MYQKKESHSKEFAFSQLILQKFLQTMTVWAICEQKIVNDFVNILI